MSEKVTFPGVVLIDNSSYCNLRCSMCDYKNISKYRTKQHMEWSLYTRIIDEIASRNPAARVWEIFFGDPFCCPDMPKRVSYAKERGLLDVVLNTNGLAMTPSKAKNLILSGLDAMYVGVDAVSPEVYNKIRVGGNLQRVVKNVIEYKNLLEKYGRGQKLFVQFVECEENMHETDMFVGFWKRLGVLVKIRPRVSWGGLIPAKNLKTAAMRTPCKWAMESVAICSDGRFALCAVDIHCQVPVGSYQKQGISEVWNGKLLEYRELHAAGRFDELPEFCKNCLDWQSANCEYY